LKTIKTLTGALFALFLFGVSLDYAQALPLFSRQTGQNCVACHAGGQYPELTPYGRYFKLTAYTLGKRTDIPVSIQFVGGAATSTNGNNGTGQVNQSGKLEPNYLFLNVGGKITDNIGAFSQWYYAIDEQVSGNGNIPNQNQFAADIQDWRYADHYVGDSTDTIKDFIWGASLNNFAGSTDVWNSSPMWMYPYMGSTRNYSTYGLPFNTRLSAYTVHNPGYGVYGYVNRNFYGEVNLYQSGGSGPLSWMTYPQSNSNPNNPPVYLQGLNPYFRFAYQSDEHAGHNWMIGFLGANINQYSSCNTVANSASNDIYRGVAPNCSGPVNSPALSAGTVKYQDRAIDSQYQYLMDPHTVTAQLRYTKENISDPMGILYSNPNNKTNSFMSKVSYVYNATYGAAIGFQNITGTADSYYGTNQATGATLNPNSTVWIPSIWYQPLQNMRLTYQYTAFTKYNGGTINYNGSGTNASANNASWLYLWLAM
jgi:hypothetical protein